MAAVELGRSASHRGDDSALSETQRRELLALIGQIPYTGSQTTMQKTVNSKTDPAFAALYRETILPEWYPSCAPQSSRSQRV